MMTEHIENKQEKNPIQVADRLFLTVELLARKGAMSLAECSTALSLSKSTVHRILSSLIYMGYVRQNEASGTYALTFKIVGIAGQIISQSDVSSAARPYLQKLMEQALETVHLVELDGTEAVYIDKVESVTNSVRMVSRIGSRIPLYCSGVGKAMAATWDTDRIRQMWDNSRILPLTSRTITDFVLFMERIRQIQSCGYATDDEENEEGVRCVAVALQGTKKEAAYAISISAPVTRMNDDRIRLLSDLLLRTKNELETALKEIL